MSLFSIKQEVARKKGYFLFYLTHPKFELNLKINILIIMNEMDNNCPIYIIVFKYD